jgi:hypothetical protein
MKAPAMKTALQALGAFAGATVVSSLLFAQAQNPPPRGEPIRRGEPIKPAAAPAVAPALAPAEGAAPKLGEYTVVGFDRLAGFNYVVPEYTGTNPPPAPDTNQIPATVKAFDGQRVALKGFMLPLKVEGGKVTELLLMRDQSMCCFGAVPKINEFVTVKMTGEGAKAVMDQAVTLFGKLKVGEFSENGYLLGVYQLDGERAEGPGM